MVHDDEPTTEYVPAPHVTQSESTVYLPATQSLQLVAPVSNDLRHGAHIVEPVDIAKLPTSQVTHAVAPLFGCPEPAAHSAQLVAPLSDWYMPGLHDVHAEPPLTPM